MKKTAFCLFFFAFITLVSAQDLALSRQITLERVLRVHTMSDFANMLLIPPTAEIQSFEIACIKANREDITYGNHSPFFAPQTETILQSAAPGDIFYIDNIVLKEGKATRKISSIFKVVDAENIVETADLADFLHIKTLADLARSMNLSASAEIQSFEINYRASPESEPVTFLNTAADLMPESKRLILLAQAGSTYHFTHISIKQYGTIRYLSAYLKINE